MARMRLGIDAIRKLCKALDLNPSITKRIIIDIPADGIVIAYVEQFTSEKFLDLLLPEVGSLDVRVLGKEENDT